MVQHYRLHREGRFHDEVQTAIRTDQEGEVLIIGVCRSGNIENAVSVFEEGVHAKSLSACCDRILTKNVGRICEPFGWDNRLIGMEPDASVRRAYRTTFGEYARKLDELQRLLDDRAADKHQLEPAIREVERARLAHNSARDVLACELLAGDPCGHQSFDPPTAKTKTAASAA
jgi:hypothetical protein